MHQSTVSARFRPIAPVRQSGVVSGHTNVSGLAIDASGNAFLTGDTDGGLDGSTLTGTSDAIVVKYNTAGTRQWTKQFGISTQATGAYGVSLDSAGNIFVTGSTGSGLDGNMQAGTTDIFVIKYNAAGARQWTSQLGVASAYTSAAGIAVDSSGNVFVAGITTGALDGNTLASNSSVMSLTKFNASGTKQWTRLDGNDATVDGTRTWGLGVSVDAIGNAYVCGESLFTNFAGTGLSGGFVSKYSSAGVRQ